jgi:hypothetical protein
VGAWGSGFVSTYLSGRVPTYNTLSECWACIRAGACGQMWVRADTKDGLKHGEHLYGACSDSLQIFSFPGKYLTSNFFWATASATQKNCISMEREHCCLTVFLAMLTAVELLQLIGVGGWGRSISSRVSQKIVACLELRNKAPSLALAAEVTTKRKIAQSVKKEPFNLIGFVGSGFQPMKKCPHAQLCVFNLDKYNALK